MKVKRYKKVRKSLEFFELAFGFKAPYKVLMDAEFLSAALEGKIKLSEQIPKVLQEEKTKLFVTKCIAKDLAHRAEKDGFWKGALMIAQKMNFLKCAHAGYVHPHECIRALVHKDNRDYSRASNVKKFKKDENGNPIVQEPEPTPVPEKKSSKSKKIENDDKDVEMQSLTSSLLDDNAQASDITKIELSTKGKGSKKDMKYNAEQLIIAAQYTTLRNELREIPVVPLLFFRGNVPMLEKPSEASIDYAATLKKNAQFGGRSGMAIVQEVKSKKKREPKLAELEKVSSTVANVLRRSMKEEADEKANKAALSVDPDLALRKRSKGPNPLSMKKKKSKPLPAHMQAKKNDNKKENTPKRPRPEDESSTSGEQEPARKRVRNRGKKTDAVEATQ